VCLTNILLITSLISLLSASLAKVRLEVEAKNSLTAAQVLEHAREEYLFM
jgi:hypothetical protein